MGRQIDPGSWFGKLGLGKALMKIIEDERSSPAGNINLYGMVFTSLIMLAIVIFVRGGPFLGYLLGLFAIMGGFIFCAMLVRFEQRPPSTRVRRRRGR